MRSKFCNQILEAAICSTNQTDTTNLGQRTKKNPLKSGFLNKKFYLEATGNIFYLVNLLHWTIDWHNVQTASNLINCLGDWTLD